MGGTGQRSESKPSHNQPVMGNICPCLRGSNEVNEYTPIEPQETNRARSRSIEKNVNNYQSIIDNTSRNFISSQPFRFHSKSDAGKNEEELEFIRYRLIVITTSTQEHTSQISPIRTLTITHQVQDAGVAS